jgi:hypothetical protein
MRHSYTYQFSASVATALLMSSIAFTSAAQTAQTIVIVSEPARWTQEDVTPEQKYSTATKESIAAQHESIKNCEILDPTQRSACVALARKTYGEEMAKKWR